MSERTCLSCGTIFYSNYGSIKCNICKQTEALEQQAEASRRQLDEINRANAYAAHQHSQAMVDAEYARIQAINRQTNVIMESSISNRDAYDRGYNYIDKEFARLNPQGLAVFMLEDGTLFKHWLDPYETDRLNEQFDRGMFDKLDSLKIDGTKALKKYAKKSGKEIATGELNPYFKLPTDVNLGGVDIYTRGCHSNFISYVDAKTGELAMEWDKPFHDDDLNEAFKDGILEIWREVNNPETKQARLDLLKKAKQLRIKDKTLNITLKVSPFIAYWLLIVNTPGMVALFSCITVYFISRFLKKKHIEWQNTNRIYL